MSLTDRDIALFARDAVFDGATSEQAMKVCAKNAIGCYSAAEKSVRDSGYRVTKRIKTGILNELLRIYNEYQTK